MKCQERAPGCIAARALISWAFQRAKRSSTIALSLVIAVAIAILGVIPLMGIPGALILEAARPLTNLLYGPVAYDAWSARMKDEMWPLCILVSLAWPVVIPLGYYAVSRFLPGQGFFSVQPVLAFLLLVLVWVVFVGQLAVLWTGKARKLTREETLETAVKAGNLRVLKSVYQPSDLGTLKTDPLADAIFDRRTEIAAFLVSQREDVNRYQPAHRGDSMQFGSPLHTAVHVNSVESARLLLEKGANPNTVNDVGQTPLHAVKWHPEGDGEILLLLKKHGADFKRVDAEGNTPLLSMAKNCLNHWDGIVKYAQILVDAGVDPRAKNKAGLSALDYAKQNGQDALVKWLER